MCVPVELHWENMFVKVWNTQRYPSVTSENSFDMIVDQGVMKDNRSKTCDGLSILTTFVLCSLFSLSYRGYLQG